MLTFDFLVANKYCRIDRLLYYNLVFCLFSLFVLQAVPTVTMVTIVTFYVGTVTRPRVGCRTGHVLVSVKTSTWVLSVTSHVTGVQTPAATRSDVFVVVQQGNKGATVINRAQRTVRITCAVRIMALALNVLRAIGEVIVGLNVLQAVMILCVTNIRVSVTLVVMLASGETLAQVRAPTHA